MPTCGRCGTENAREAKFCRQCGATLSLSTAKVDIGEVLGRAQRAKEEAEAQVHALEEELKSERQQRSAAIGERDTLAPKLSSAELKLRKLEKQIDARTAEIEELRRALAVREQELADRTKELQARDVVRTDNDRLARSVADSKAKIAELERRLKTEQARTGHVGARRRWVAPLVAAALLLVAGLGIVEGVRGRSARARSAGEIQRLRDKLAGSTERESRLREEVASLRRIPVAGPPATTVVEGESSAGDARLRRGEQMLAKRSAELNAREREVEELQRRLVDERAQVAAERTELKAARDRLQRAAPTGAQPSAAAGAVTSSSPDGYLVWQGRVAQPTTIVVTGNQANFGAVSGSLPGRECDIRDETTINARVRMKPAKNNGWRQARIEPQPGRLATVVFVWSCR